MRTTKVEIAGAEYWLAFSTGSQMLVDAMKKKGLDPKTSTTEWFFTLLVEELRVGYRWAIRNGETANQPPAAEDLVDMIDINEIGALTPVLLQIMKGERNVIAKPQKKDEASLSSLSGE